MKKGGWTAGWIWLPILTLIFFWAVPVSAAENSKCLECHKDPKLSKGKKNGALLSLHVDEKAFQASVHGAAGLGCVDCHAEAKAPQHPAEKFPEGGCGSCHGDQVEAYKRTSHGMMAESGMEKAPKCVDCHTAHEVVKINDPKSPFREAGLPAVCEKCHEQAKPGKGFFTALATYRILGHPKGNLAENYSTQACVKCHPENTGHPQKPLTPACVRCHDKSLTTPLLMGPIHVKMSFHEQPLQFILRILYGLGFTVVVLGAVGWFGYRFYQRKKTKKGETGGGEGNLQDSGS
jgi:hypothetical protein